MTAAAYLDIIYFLCASLTTSVKNSVLPFFDLKRNSAEGDVLGYAMAFLSFHPVHV